MARVLILYGTTDGHAFAQAFGRSLEHEPVRRLSEEFV